MWLDYQVCLGADMRLDRTIKLVAQCHRCQAKVFRCFLIVEGILSGD